MATNVDKLIAARARTALDCLEHLTTDDFATGGDRPARDALAAILWLVLDADAGDEDMRDYSVAIDEALRELHGFELHGFALKIARSQAEMQEQQTP